MISSGKKYEVPEVTNIFYPFYKNNYQANAKYIPISFNLLNRERLLSHFIGEETGLQGLSDLKITFIRKEGNI